MRLAAALSALLVLPAVAHAQGRVVFVNGRDFPMTVNASECGSHATVLVTWSVALMGGLTTAPSGATYQLYASDQDPATNPAGANTCFKVNSTSPVVYAGQLVDAQGDNPILFENAVIDLTDFLAKAGLSCANSGTTVWICVEGSASGVKFGYAAAAVTVSTAIPPPPVITAIAAGDGALRVTWEPGASTTAYQGDSYEGQLTAELVGTTSTATDPYTHVSPMFVGTTARIGGLVNGVIYGVTARAFSTAGNASDPSMVVTAIPHASAGAGGSGGGGCATGLAGPLALALLAVGLALARRAP